MKKFIAVLCMITCIFGLTACGAGKEDMTYDKAAAESLVSMLYQNICMENADAFYTQLQEMDETDLASVEALFRQYGLKVPGDVLKSGLSSYVGSMDELGSLTEIKSYDFKADADSLTVLAVISGSLHDAKMEIVFNRQMGVTDITVNPVYSFGEQMERAALNTLMGMGTVFAVLILISLLIYCMVLIPKIQARFSKKSKEEVAVKEVPAVEKPVQIQEPEELSDDSELVAVIAAAIAASEGAATVEGFMVRSVRRSSANRWKRA